MVAASKIDWRVMATLIVGLCLANGSAGLCLGASDALLDEIIDGNEANAALIEHGTATYTVVTANLARQTPAATEKIVVYFDGKRTRTDSGATRSILDDERVIDYQPQDHDIGVIIRPRNEANPLAAHPKMQGLDRMGSLADVIRALRKSSEVRLEISEEAGSLIKITANVDSQFAKDEFWVAKEQGYNAIRHRKWALKSPELPYVEIDAEFRQADNGAFVLAHALTTCRVAIPNEHGWGLQDQVRQEVTLDEIDLTHAPTPVLFTLAGLGLPNGLRVQERIAREELQWNGATQQLESPSRQPSRRTSTATAAAPPAATVRHSDWLYGLVVFVVACIGAVGWWLYRK